MATKKVTVTATLGQSFTVESDMRGHRLFVDQPTNAGGADKGPTPLEYLFLALGGCIASVGRIVAMQQRLTVRGMEVTVEGDLDVDFLLGKSRDGRAGFGAIVVRVAIDSDMTEAEKRAFLKEVDRRCPVSDNLLQTTPVHVELA